MSSVDVTENAKKTKFVRRSSSASSSSESVSVDESASSAGSDGGSVTVSEPGAGEPITGEVGSVCSL